MILLIDFGSAPEARSVRSYLEAIFSDPHIAASDRHPLVRRTAARTAACLLAGRTRRRYQRVEGMLSPTKDRNDLAKKLEAMTGMRVVWATRYARPTIEEKMNELMRDGFRRVIVIPLFPHHSIAMTDSIIAECERVLASMPGNTCEVTYIRSWIDSPAFTRAWARPIRERFKSHIIFSAHAVPLQHVTQRGCPYQKELERSIIMMHQALDRSTECHLAYQSRRRTGHWLGPTVDQTLNTLLKQGVRDCLVVPLSFVFENVETLVDLDMELIPRFRQRGMEGLIRVPTPGSSDEIVNTLAELVENLIRP